MSRITVRCIGFDWRSCSDLIREAARRAGGILNQRVSVVPAAPRDRLERYNATLVAAEYLAPPSPLGVVVDLKGLDHLQAVGCVCKAILKAVNRDMIKTLNASKTGAAS